MLSSVTGTVLELTNGPLITSSNRVKTGRMSVFLESNETSFHYGLGIVPIHALPDAILKDMSDYFIILSPYTIKSAICTRRTDKERQLNRKSRKLTYTDNAIDERRNDDNDEPSTAEALLMLA